MVFFNGTIKLKICEAVDLRATDFATRHQVGSQKNISMIDPYISVDVDDVPVARTTTVQKSAKPSWNEDFSTEVHNGQTIGLTVFHDAAIPPDEFVANCTIAFDDLSGKLSSDIWVRGCLIFVRGFGPVVTQEFVRFYCIVVPSVWTPFRLGLRGCQPWLSQRRRMKYVNGILLLISSALGVRQFSIAARPPKMPVRRLGDTRPVIWRIVCNTHT